MTRIVSIVEGDGEVAALPVLLRRLGQMICPGVHLDVQTPIRVRKDRFLNNGQEFARMIAMAANYCGRQGWGLVLLDADDDCPVSLAASILQRAAPIAPRLPLSVVIANREYEAWFIASAVAIANRRGLALDGATVPEAEVPRNAKGWVKQHLMNGIYGETTDQPKLTAAMDLAEVLSKSRSFRKLKHDFEQFSLATNSLR